VGGDTEGLAMGKLLDMFAEAGIPVDDLRGKLPTNPHNPFKLRELTGIKGIVVHHTAGWPQATAEGLALWEIEKRDFEGMPYTFYLRMPYSTEPMPYPWAFCHKLTEWGAQALGANAISFGVALGGNYLYTKPPLWMVDSMVKLTDVLVRFFKDEVGTEVWVKPHYAVSQTSCPGKVWEAYQEHGLGDLNGTVTA
jgi:hypothetical protein